MIPGVITRGRAAEAYLTALMSLSYSDTATVGCDTFRFHLSLFLSLLPPSWLLMLYPASLLLTVNTRSTVP